MSFFTDFYESTGFPKLFDDPVLLVKTLIMYVIIGLLFYLAVVKKFEPLLLLPIAFGMLLANLPGANLFHMDFFIHEDGSPINIQYIVENGSLLDFLYLGVKLGIYPSLIFLGVGAMTDFSALIANPKSLLLGAAAQFGVFAAFIGAIFLGFTPEQASAIGIIGGADGPTAILVTKILAPELLGAIAIAAYSYMALIPIIQPPFMKLLTTEKERKIRMTTLRTVTKTEKVLFPSDRSGCSAPCRLPDVRQPPQCQWCDRQNLQDRPERTDEYRHNLPRRIGWRDGKRRQLPRFQHRQDHLPRSVRILPVHRRRSAWR